MQTVSLLLCLKQLIGYVKLGHFKRLLILLKTSKMFFFFFYVIANYKLAVSCLCTLVLESQGYRGHAVSQSSEAMYVHQCVMGLDMVQNVVSSNAVVIMLTMSWNTVVSPTHIMTCCFFFFLPISTMINSYFYSKYKI